MSLPTSFSGVTVHTKANVYFDGKVVSHTVRFPDGSRKTLGFIAPGSFHFNTDAAERMDIDVMDIFGKRVMAEQIAAPGGAFVHTMDLSYLAPGVYMVNVRVGERMYTQRLVRQ